MVEISTIVQIIQKILPKAQIKLIDAGTSPDKIIKRTTIKVSNEIEFNIGENLIFILKGNPIKVLKYLPLASNITIEEFIIECLQTNITNTTLPLVKDLAQKNLGKEKKIEIINDCLYVRYEKFYLIISPISIILVQNKDNRAVYFAEYKDKKLEDIFITLKYHAKQINEDK